MPYTGSTPEPGISRSDSKDPATTCRGITASGLPCRRSLATSPSPSPNSSPQRKAAAPKPNGHLKQDITAFYCWQHKDQAETIIRRTTWNKGSLKKQRRSSIDTLMERLGVMDINDSTNTEKPTKPPNRKKQKRHTFCCFTIIEEDDEPAPLTPKPRPTAAHAPAAPARPRPQQQHIPQTNTQIQSSSRPNALLPWIPASLSPQTTSLLLAELAKPISAADEPGYIYMFWVTPSTATSTSTSRSISDISVPPPLEDIASSLLPVRKSRNANRDRDRGISITIDPSSDSDTDETPEQIQRSNTAIRRARDLNNPSTQPTNTGTVRLKIGRTSNVTRRLNEWSKQCSNHLTLIRYYPYTPSSGRGKGDKWGFEPGKKVPHVHRVERLIHLELAETRIQDLGPCPECGREHKEWFEVAAERAALKRVDECIRRWVHWAHTQK
ncbi:uncharacterized protein BDV17DRAFT_147557 [Aspergillus undulatus]|uniref:uncharacterized protein n=1 Tax=Aspergillus undulatus TaxID=1810928 RepID=UPI003CCD6BD9